MSKLCLLVAAAVTTFLLLPQTGRCDLISYWDFEGDFTDSVGINDAVPIPDDTFTNDVTTGADANRSGQVLILDGLGDGLMTPANTTLDFGLGSSFTYSFWVKAQDNNQTGNVDDRSTFLMRDTQSDPYNGHTVIINATASHAGPYFRGSLDGGTPGILSETTNQTEVDDVLDDQWHHIAWVVKGVGLSSGSSTMYFDGAVLFETDDLSAVAGGTTSSGAQPLYIGAERANGNKWVWGSMDDVAVWNDSLPAESIAALASESLSPIDVPVAYDAMNLVVRVDDGAVRLLNFSGEATDIDGYRIRSVAGSLSPAGWQSLEELGLDANGSLHWDEVGNSATELSEGYFGSGSVFADASFVSLGDAYNTTVDAGDLIFEYHLAGLSPGFLVPADVIYTELGDMDLDGDVDNDDVPLFVQALVNRSAYEAAVPGADADFLGDFDGNGILDFGDIGYFSAKVASATSNTSAVPEPASALLLTLATCCFLCRIQHRSCGHARY